MGLNYQSSHDLFSLEWQRRLKTAPESAMEAIILLYHRVNGSYDPGTDTWGNTDTSVYSGKARVQPMRASTPRVEPGNETQIQNVLVSIPIANAGLDIRPGLRVDVVSSLLNPSLVTYQFVVSEIMDSSNPIERTFMCTVDQETVNNDG